MCTKLSYLQLEQSFRIWVRQLHEGMLKTFQDNRKSWPSDINVQCIPLPPIVPASGIQTNCARKRKFRRSQKEKREAEEHLRRAKGELGQLMSWLRTDRWRFYRAPLLSLELCFYQQATSHCSTLWKSLPWSASVSGLSPWSMNFMTSWPLIPRLSHWLLLKITWGDHGTSSFGQKFMEQAACIEMHMLQHGNQRKYERRWVRKEERGRRETKLIYSHFPSWSTTVRKAFVLLQH